MYHICPVMVMSAANGSACNTSCIIGIVVSFIGVIILAAIVAGVAYGVYTHLKKPDTNVSKYPGSNTGDV